MLLGEAPGEQEVLKGEPFVGFAGQELNKMLADARISRNLCFITNVIRQRPPENDLSAFIPEKKTDITPQHVFVQGKACLPIVRDGVEMLKREIEMCRPNVIIAFGNVSLWALTGKWGIKSWRGSVLECNLDLALDYKPKVVPVYHPSYVLRQWSERQVAVHDLKRAAAQSNFPEIIRPEYQFVIRPDFGTVMSVLKQLTDEADRRSGSGKLKLSNDIETRAGHIACVGIAWSKTAAMCIPLMCVDKPEGYWTLEEEFEIFVALKRLLTHPNVEGVGQNFLYDMQYYNRWFLYHPTIARDTMLAQHTMFSTMQKGLDFLSSMYCDHHEYWKDEGKEWDPKKHNEDQYWSYNCKDAVITFEVDDAEQQAIQALSVNWKKLPDIQAFQQKLFWPVLETMNKGIRADVKTRSRFAAELFDEIAQREQWLADVLGFPVNIKSPLQMKELFYGILKQKPILGRTSGTPSCDDESLRKLAEREPLLRPVVKKISELRSLGVFLGTFVNAPLDVDGRLRCSFNIAGTETYRFASKKNAFGSGLNMQNIPKGGETEDGEDALELPNVRKLFLPDPGKTFFDIDLDSADLRIVAWEAEIQEMKDMLAEGKKVYVEVMKEYHKNPNMTKHDRQYKVFKGLCHGTNYLGSSKGLAERLGLLVHEVEVIQKWYFGKFPRLKKWHNELKDQVLKRRMVENIFGYRCYFFDRVEGTVFNQAVAWIPQSTVGCLINRAYVNIHEQHKDIEVLLQVHDSLAGQFDTRIKDDAMRRIVAAAEIPLPYDDPCTIPVGIVTSDNSWGDCG
jgi:uracil-DNA glycosylase family 4